jgi:hypothetical protein
MLSALLKNASSWVYSIFFDNKIADAEERLYSDWFKEEVDDERL